MKMNRATGNDGKSLGCVVRAMCVETNEKWNKVINQSRRFNLPPMIAGARAHTHSTAQYEIVLLCVCVFLLAQQAREMIWC